MSCFGVSHRIDTSTPSRLSAETQGERRERERKRERGEGERKRRQERIRYNKKG